LKGHYVDVPEALMPMPCHLIAPPKDHEAHRLCKFNVEKVQVIGLTLYHHTSADVNLVANPIELPDAHDVGY
jgi:hypothetical protein